MKKRDLNFSAYWSEKRLNGKWRFVVRTGLILFLFFLIFMVTRDLFMLPISELFSVEYFGKIIISNLIGSSVGAIVMWYLNEFKYKKLKKDYESNRK